MTGPPPCCTVPSNYGQIPRFDAASCYGAAPYSGATPYSGAAPCYGANPCYGDQFYQYPFSQSDFNSVAPQDATKVVIPQEHNSLTDKKEMQKQELK